MKFFGTIFDLFEPSDDHSVIINFNYYQEELDDLHHLADRLRTHLNGSDIGEYDGHETEVGGSDANLYLYGQNAETLFLAVKPILDQTSFMRGAQATLRFGPIGRHAKEITVTL